MTRTPGATSRLPAPPSTIRRATPARESPSSRARAAAGSVSGTLPNPVPTVLIRSSSSAPILPDGTLRAHEPRQPGDRERRGDEEVQAQPEDVLGRVDA